MSLEDKRDVTDEGPINFPLSKPFNYHSKAGTSESAGWIELTAPAPKHSREVTYLEQAFLRAASEQAGDDDEENSTPASVEGDSDGPNPIGVVAVIAMSSEDFPAVMDVAKKLFSNGVATIEGEVKLTSNAIENLMSLRDLEKMLGVYLLNFTLASSLAQTPTSTPQ